MFKLSSKEHAALQGFGVFLMSCAFHNLMHWMPGPAALAFSPEYVARILQDSPPNSLRVGGNYYTLDGSSAAAPAADAEETATAAAPAADKPNVTILRTEHDASKGGSGHKTIKAGTGD